MRIALDALPTDTDALHQLVRDLAGALSEGQTEIDRLRLVIPQFRRAQFGRRSEQLDPDQMRSGLKIWRRTSPAPRHGCPWQRQPTAPPPPQGRVPGRGVGAVDKSPAVATAESLA